MMVRARYDSWGRVDRRLRAARPFAGRAEGLPYGLGRSYGDTCHDDEGVLTDMRSHAGIITFCEERGLVWARAGTTLADIAELALPNGWFLPVTPGTKFVTLGGAIANDVHGKNHHVRGTFGSHVEALTLLRSDGSRNRLEPGHPLFSATIGGMGLTGIVTDARLRLVRVPGARVAQTAAPFGSIEEYVAEAHRHEAGAEYSVAWIDALSRDGRGIVLNGNHIEGDGALPREPRLRIPFTPSFSPLNRAGIAAFNTLYRASTSRRRHRVVSLDSYFYPLDALGGWNRLYGPDGLVQHQSLVPCESASTTLSLLLQTARDHGHASFLTVLKRFGECASPGLLSFPRPGFTLTLDFPNRGEPTARLLDRLDQITLDAGGRTNPYKDGRMSAATFQRGFPRWRELEAHRDPVISSNFWRRVAPHRTAPQLAEAAE